MFGIPAYLIWLVIMIALVVFESVTMDLNCIWFAFGALCSFILSFFGIGWITQLVVFAVVSGLFLLLVRPIALKHINIKRTATNADRVIGTRGIVTEKIDNDLPSGQVKAGGQIWSARAEQPEDILEVGDVVEIVDIRGVKLICRKK